MRDVLRFTTGQPEEVALKFGEGLSVQSQYGDQMLYTLTDDRVMYLDLKVARRIDELGIGRGERFSIGKFEQKIGNKKSVAWEVKRVDPATPPGEDRTNAPTTTTQEMAQRVEAPSNGNNNGHATTQINAKAPEVPQPCVLEELGFAAIDAIRSVEQYAREHGRPIQFASEDIRAVWISMFIEATKGGRTWSK